MKVYRYEVRILKSSEYDNKFITEELEVGLQNDRFIVLLDDNFTRINKNNSTGSDLDRTLNCHRVSEWKMGLKSLDGIHYNEFSSHRVRPETIKRRIKSFIKSEYGYLSEINLDFIK